MTQRLIALLTSSVFPVIGLLFWFVVVSPTAAVDHTVGGACGATIQACIDFASPGDTIIIPANTYNESLTLLSPINLQGAAGTNPIITPPAGQRALLISGTAILSDTIIENIDFDGADAYLGVNGCFSDICGGAIAIRDGAFPTLRNLDVTNNRAYSGGGIHMEAGTSLILEDSTLIGNEAVFTGGGIDLDGNALLPSTNTIVISNTLISNNVAIVSGAGGSFGAQPANFYDIVLDTVIVASNVMTCSSGNCDGAGLDIFDSSTVFIQDSLFQENMCVNNGGNQCSGAGLSLSGIGSKRPKVTIINTDFISNTAGGRAGGIQMFGNSADSFIDITGGVFSGNTAEGEDGGALIASGNIMISGTQFISNTAQESGGAIQSDLGTLTFQITNSHFEKNRAMQTDGGAIVIAFSAPMEITNTDFFSNTAGNNGGAIGFAQVVVNTGMTASSSSFSNNSTTNGDGGAVYMSGDLNLTNVDFTNNTAGDDGGAVYVGGGGVSHTMIGGLFQENAALALASVFSRGGGALNITSGDVTISGTQFLTNTATPNIGGGGAIFTVNDVTVTNGYFQGNQSSDAGGAIAQNFFSDNKIVYLTDTTLVNNQADGFGGGVLAINLTTQRGLIQANTATNAGGVYVADTVRMTDTQILNNVAITTGGGVYAPGGFDLPPHIFTNLLVSGNQAQNGIGGGFYLGFTEFFTRPQMTGVQILNNVAEGNGGGIGGSPNLNIVDSTIAGNTVNGSGGGLYTAGSIFMTNTMVLSNTAVVDGGGLFVNSTLEISGGMIRNNGSGRDGGGIRAGRLGILEDVTVIDNSAAENAGGVFVTFRLDEARNNLFQNNTAQGYGGGLLVNLRELYLFDSQFISNTADFGGAIAVTGTSGTVDGSVIVNSVFASNQANLNEGADIYYEHTRPLAVIHSTLVQGNGANQQAITVYSGTVGITNTIVASYAVGIQNQTGVVNLVDNLYFNNTVNNWFGGNILSSGEIVANPMFVDPVNHDFRLVIGSPAIDSGVDAGITADILGVARPVNGVPDRGAYEGPHTPTAVSLQTVAITTDSRHDVRYSFTIIFLVFATLFGLCLNFRARQYRR